MPVTSAGGAKVYYESHGEGPALLFAHGSGGHHAIWWQQIPHFRARYRVLTIDFPGFGKSDSGPETWDVHRYPAAILAVLDDAGVDRAVLVGQSLGCAPALALAIEHPERVSAVVLAHSMAGITDEPLASQVRADRKNADTLTVLDRLLSKRFQAESPELVTLFQQLGTFNAAKPSDLRNRELPLAAADVRGAVKAGVSVTFLQGTADAVVTPACYDALRELLPEVRVETVAGAPHSLYWEQAPRFNAALDRILAGA